METRAFQHKPWRRVTKACPCSRCLKGDWCLISEDAVMCMRVPGGKPYKLRDGSIGYIYPRDSGPVRLPPRPKPAPSINARSIIEQWGKDTTREWIRAKAKQLGVTEESLRDLEVTQGPKPTIAAFPMHDGDGNTVGIRLRSDSGFKWAVDGSHQGIFTPLKEATTTAYVCEGPTDTAAALSLGLWAVGRASCSSGLLDIPKVFRRLRVRRAVIISDNDNKDQGQRGAEMLGRQLGIPYCILMLPFKDLRAFVRAGGTAVQLQDMLNDIVWENP